MPKSIGGLWESVVSWANLHHAFREAERGKRYRDEVLRFKSNLEEELTNIQNLLIWKQWMPSRWIEFYTYDPKKRLIQAPQFKDRVVHHALVRTLEPAFERKFIFDSYACRKGKGTHASVMRLQEMLRCAQAKGITHALKADISKYFPSINHGRLIEIVGRTIRDKDVLWLCKKIVLEGGYLEKGIPVGALTSQLFANAYLDILDHFIKDQLGIRYYLRYMDDFVLLASKPELQDLLNCIDDFLSGKLYLTLNPKTCIFPISHGVDFAGYRTWPTHILPRKRNIKRARRKFRQLSIAYAKGEITLRDVRPRVMSFLGWTRHCSARRSTKSTLNRLVLRRTI